jgi:beta-lactamase regulating signal transducer with metallopeptidase domain
MSFFFIYLIKLSVSLSVVFIFYHFILQKLTFYNHNRWYLLGYTLLSFFIPFINISAVLEKNNWNTNDAVTWIPVIHTTTEPGLPENTPGAFNVWAMIISIIAAGMIIMFVRLLLQLLSFHRMMKKALPVSTEGMNLYQVNENIIPFSFGNSIFINRHLHNKKELEEIIRHEFVHVKQRHSLDIIWAELLCLVNWFNPFAWMLRRSIRQNLEFIADHKVLENGINKKEYQYLLLKVIGNNQYSIAAQFNFSSLKKRIAMMNKLKSAKVHLLKFLFLMPVVIVMLLAFRSKYEHSVIPAGRNTIQDTLPAKPKLPDAILSIGLMQSREDAGSTDPIQQKLHGLVGVKRKDGGIEVYDLDSKEHRDAFEKKYGVKLEDLIPPPPPPPMPAKPVEGVIPAVPVAPVAPVRNGQIFSVTTPMAETVGKEINLSGISNEYEITDKKAVIKLKNGTIEKYDLSNKKERAAFEKKYGKIIHVNTNINTNAKVNVNTNVNATVDVTPVAVTVDGKTITSTVAPVTIVGVHSATTVIAPALVTGKLSATSVTPAALTGKLSATSITSSPIRSAVSGTTVITPMATTEGVTVIDDYGPTITGKEDIMIVITSKTTRQELEDYKKKMKEKGIELSYDKVEYNDKGLLVSISGTMKAEDGQSNFVAADFDALVLARIKQGEKNWFKVSVKDKKVI